MSNTLSIAENLLAEMNESEKKELLQWILQDLDSNATGIEISPNICGGAARIAGTRIPVWVLAQARRLGANEMQILDMYPTLQPEDLTHAWSFIRKNRQQIDLLIQENENA